MDPYKFLGLKYGADIKTVRNRFKKLVLIHHPDKGGDRAVFEKIRISYNMIYNILKEEEEEHKLNTESVDLRRKKYMKSLKKTKQEEEIEKEKVEMFKKKMRGDPGFFNEMFEKTRVKTYKDYSYWDLSPEELETLKRKRQEKYNRKNLSVVKKYREPKGAVIDDSGLLAHSEPLGVEMLEDHDSEILNVGFSDIINAFIETDHAGMVMDEEDKEKIEKLKTVDAYRAYSDRKMKEKLSPEQLKYQEKQHLKEKRKNKLRKINQQKRLEREIKSKNSFLNFLEYKDVYKR